MIMGPVHFHRTTKIHEKSRKRNWPAIDDEEKKIKFVEYGLKIMDDYRLFGNSNEPQM